MLKRAKRIILGLGMSVSAISVNGMELNGTKIDAALLRQNNGALTYSFPGNPNNFSFKIEGNKINCGVMSIQANGVEQVKNIFGQIQQSGGGMFCGSSINMKTKSCQPGVLSAEKSINLTSQIIQDQMAFITSPVVNLQTQEIHLQGFFQNMKEWTLSVNPEYNNPPSKLESITFYKNDSSNLPFAFFGDIDFDFQKLDGSNVLMMGANKVTFKFNPEAFK